MTFTIALPAEEARDAQQVNILLVDDQPENLIALEQTLDGLGQNLVLARNGREALKYLLEHDCALIILDVVMPDMDGFETARLIRERDASRQIPIIFLTADDRSEAKLFKGYSVGAVDYLHKPFNADVLRSKVQVFVELAKKTELLKDQERLLREKNAELARAKERAERESRFKSRFLAGMSHELRTPLNAILGFSEMLEQELFGPLNARQKDYVGLVLQSGRHLLALVNDILDISKVEAGRMDLARERMPLGRVVTSVSEIVRTLADRQGVSLSLEVGADLPDVVVDLLRMKQVLYNLLSNAIKFTPAGGAVALSARAEAPWLELTVSDTGVGIRAEDMPRLFHEFDQIEAPEGAFTVKPDGTGLGLALTQRLVVLQGGSIAVSSEVGRGTKVTVRLPLADAPLPVPS